jgi:hypothetical protein
VVKHDSKVKGNDYGDKGSMQDGAMLCSAQKKRQA